MSKENTMKLPVWGLVKLAIFSTVSNWRYALFAGWVSFLLICAVQLIGMLMGASSHGFGIFLLDSFSSVIWASFSVAWHRFLLIGETVSEKNYFRFDKRVVIFAAYSILFLIVFFILLQLVEQIGGLVNLNMYILLPVKIVLIYLFIRFSLIFPAVALGLDGIGLGDVWKMTAGNSWRLIAGNILLGILALLVLLPIIAFSVLSGSNVAMALLMIPLTTLFMVVGLSFLSHVFVLLYHKDSSTPWGDENRST